MKNYKSATAFRTALEDRLRARGRKLGVNPQRLWSLVAFDRLLARLLKDKDLQLGDYDGVEWLTRSHDGNHWICAVRNSGKSYVLDDGLKGPEFDVITRVLYPKKGKGCAYIARRGDQECVVFNGNAGEFFDAIDKSSLEFSPDAERIAYVAHSRESALAVIDGVRGKPYDEISDSRLVFSPDGSRIAYVARSRGRDVVVVDAVEHTKYRFVFEATIGFSPKGDHIAFVAAMDGEPPCLYLDGEAKKNYAYDLSGPVLFSSDGLHLGYRRSLNSRSPKQAILDGVSVEEFEQLTFLGLTPDGKGYVGIVREGGLEFAVSGRARGKALDQIYKYWLKEHENRLSLIGRKGSELWMEVFQLQ